MQYSFLYAFIHAWTVCAPGRDGEASSLVRQFRGSAVQLEPRPLWLAWEVVHRKSPAKLSYSWYLVTEEFFCCLGLMCAFPAPRTCIPWYWKKRKSHPSCIRWLAWCTQGVHRTKACKVQDVQKRQICSPMQQCPLEDQVPSHHCGWLQNSQGCRTVRTISSMVLSQLTFALKQSHLLVFMPDQIVPLLAGLTYHFYIWDYSQST